MRLDSLFYRTAYRLGRPAWDTGEPEPELEMLALGRVPGRALDLGCGTGTDAIDLARRGWQVVGIDFASEAIDKAKAKAAAAGVKVEFVVGDVSRLAGRRDHGPVRPADRHRLLSRDSCRSAQVVRGRGCRSRRPWGGPLSRRHFDTTSDVEAPRCRGPQS
jgi:SAM-dependent methyltransferase